MLVNWTPVRPSTKAVWQSSALSDGRQLRDIHYNNMFDTFTLTNRHQNVDMLIRACQNLDRLLIKARQYWTTAWQTEPVYLVARGSAESNVRYAVIYDYSFPQEDNPYSQPVLNFFSKPSMTGLTLTIEHGLWQAVIPGTDVGICISAEQEWDGSMYGRDDNFCLGSGIVYYLLNEDGINAFEQETGGGLVLLESSSPTELVDEWYIINHQKIAQLTHSYYYDASGPVWSGNLIGAAMPFEFYPNPVANGDICYWGIDTSVGDTGPFCSLVFDLQAVSTYTGAATMEWQYWDGGAWAQLTVQDNTGGGNVQNKPFQEPGVNSVHWVPPDDWATTAVNGVTGYWVRAIASIPAPPGDSITTPSQRNRDFYTIDWASVKVAENVIGGDVEALGRILLHVQSDYDVGTVSTELYLNRALVGLRSINRGSDFLAYLNFADEQNLAGITVTPEATDSAFTNAIEAPTGRAVDYTPGAVRSMAEEVRVEIAAPLVDDYFGVYHAFVRYHQTYGSAGDIGVRLHVVADDPNGTLGYYTDTLYTETTNEWAFFDFGRLELPPGDIQSPDLLMQMYIVLELSTSNAAATMRAYDLILIPTDEWAGDFVENITESSTAGISATSQEILDIDSTTHPNRRILSFLKDATNDQIMTRYVPITTGHMILQANAIQRLWFFFAQSYDETGLPRRAKPCLSASIRVGAVQRYLGSRGNR